MNCSVRLKSSYYRLLCSFWALYVALFGLCFLLYSPAIAQTSRNSSPPAEERVRGLNPVKSLTQYVFETWQSEDGFQQSGVRALCQTKDGYVWIGASEGLVRFDGARFVVFDKSNLPLKSNSVTSLVEGKDGALWVGTEQGLLCIRKGKFTLTTTKEGLPDNVILALAEDTQGNIWVGTENGLAMVKNDKITKFSTDNGLTSNLVLSLRSDGAGGMWIGTNGGGINHYTSGTFQTFVVIDGQFRPYTRDDGLVGANVNVLLTNTNGVLWAGTSEGLFRIENYSLRSYYNAASGLGKDDIRALTLDRENTLWIGLNGGGVARITSSDAVSTFTTQQGLSADEVFAVLEDHEGALWMGTDGGGLARFKDRRFTSFTAKDGLTNNNVSVVSEGADGSIWMATNGGLNKYSAGTWSSFSTQNGLLNNIVTSLWNDRAGNLWVGTRLGLQKLAGTTFTNYTKNEGLPDNSIQVIYEDKQGTIWAGTESGLAKLSNNQWTTLTTKNGLGSNSVRVILEDSRGMLWIGTRGGGLSSLNNGSIANYTLRDGLASNFIWSLYEDSNGVLWIGTGGGLSRYKDGKFATITTHDGLYSDIVFSVQEDEAGWLWMSSNKGVFRVRKSAVNDVLDRKEKRITCIAYGVVDGMKSAECNGGSQPSVWKSRLGQLLYPTIKGLAIVEPLTIPYNPLTPPVILERVIADERLLRLPGVLAFQYKDASTKDEFDNATTEQFSEDGKTIELAPGIDKFEFQYTATSLLMPERVRFRYKLEGFDDDWVDAGTRRTAYYTSLPRGKEYRFHVIASNNDGVWNEVGASTSFYLKPYFYETAWFIGLMACLVIVGAVAAYILRVRQVEKRNRELERIVAERTDEVRKQAKEIERANGDLKEKNERLSVVSGIGRELTSSLTFETIVSTVYQRFYEVMDATMFSIGLLRPWSNTIEYKMSIDKGMRLPLYEMAMDDKNQFAVWCMDNAKEIIIQDVDRDGKNFIPDFRKTINPLEGLMPEIDSDYPKSLMYMPLLVRGEVIGTLSVQSFKRGAYTQNHIEIARTLTNYVAIAISNSEQFEELQRKQRMITEFNKHITDSINYAKRIQTAMLPHDDHISEALSDYFILFRPRDVVSGDFYWYSDKGDRIYIAAVDCTGHGVPGAFMSLIGNSLLNEVVNSQHNPEPGTLLSELHKGVQRSLRQTETNNRDGMDITLCMIDKTNRTIEYAGAMNPLYIMKNGEFIEVKADKKPIGGIETDDRVFTNNTIDVSDAPVGSVMLYMSSDGFKDQFGGEKGKKFSSKRLIEICQNVHAKKCDEQKAIFGATMDEWMGTSHKQLDDMLVIGVRV
jgi:ligand-binding sensor domain-containing protein/serine phosphatase RsbU (regulator of sigma subunit)